MSDFNASKIFSVSGALLQLIGLSISSWIGLNEQKAKEMDNSLREGIPGEYYTAAMSDYKYEPSSGELEADRLKRIAETSSRKFMRVGLTLAALGALFQLLGAITS